MGGARTPSFRSFCPSQTGRVQSPTAAVAAAAPARGVSTAQSVQRTFRNPTKTLGPRDAAPKPPPGPAAPARSPRRRRNQTLRIVVVVVVDDDDQEETRRRRSLRRR